MKKFASLITVAIIISNFFVLSDVFCQITAKNTDANKILKPWSVDKAQEWYKNQAWIVGANFIPSDASNQLEMWQADTWNPALIDKELGFAQQIGMNTVRVYLHYFPYRDDKDGFLKRINEFLAIADKHNIKVILIFFDSVWDPNPLAGKQKEPKKHVHNANWVQSPGKEYLFDTKKHILLKLYVQDIMQKHKSDGRVLFWDLYNEPDNKNSFIYKDKGKTEYSLILLKEVFTWAREVNPSQPITSAPWIGNWSKPKKLSDFNKFMFENSDIITFHNYLAIKPFMKRDEMLKRYNRPIICTEYMARGRKSLFSTHLPYMKENNIGAINWGLVSGRTQTIYPYLSLFVKFKKEPKLWFHDVLYPDGKAYIQEEVDLIKKLSQLDKSDKKISNINHRWDTIINGKPVNIYRLMNKNSVEIRITNYGGKVVSIKVPDRNGKYDDIVLGYDNIKETVAGNLYFGSLIGRYGNRIAKGKFTIDGKEYHLKTNNGYNALHGGLVGYNDVVWKAEQQGNKLILTHTDPDMFEGYPGNVEVQVIYELTDKNELKITYDAVSDKATPINLTHHSFFNLKGAGSGTILKHKLFIAANHYTPIDTTLIPTGEIAPVKGTAFDFTTATEIGKNINKDMAQIKNGFGFDHNWVLNKQDGKMSLAARVSDPVSGRFMEVYTTEPGLQFYAGNFLDGSDVGKGGKKYLYRTAFCLETQHYPDSPNHKAFPNTILRTGQEYHSETIYKFGVEK